MATAIKPLNYSKAACAMHWAMGAGMVGCIGTVQAAMNTKPKEKTLGLSKMEWMKYHKSIALLVAALVPARLGIRLMKQAPAHVPGTTKLEQLAADASHLAMYGFIAVMPATGITMGYFGGKGLPFFGYTIPGAAEKDGKLAGQAFKIHKQAGLFFEYLTALHVGAAVTHLIRGHAILARIGIGAMPK